MKKKTVFIVEKTNTGFSAYAQDYGIATTGIDMDELKSNILEAATLHFAEHDVVIQESDIELKIDYKQLFEFYDVLNAKVFARKIGMNQTLLSQYMNGGKKLTSKQQAKIKEGIKKVASELQQISFI